MKEPYLIYKTATVDSEPQWIIKEDQPLFFLGQFEIKDCQLFRDNGFVYLFVNGENGEIETVKQFY